MKIIELEQGSLDWHEFRKNHIGGSDAPSIMGVSPWKTRYELWEEKLGLYENLNTTYAMQRGHDLENSVRKQINITLNCDLVPCVFEHDEHEFLSASVDGYDIIKNTLVEIKCPGKFDHDFAKNGRIPSKYYPQLQHILLVSGLDEIIYVSYLQDDLVMITVSKNEEYIKNLLHEECNFWDCLENLYPPEITDMHKKYVKHVCIQRDGYKFKDLSFEWKLLQDSKKDLLEKEAKLKDEIVKNCEEKDSEFYGIRCKKIKKTGHVDYSKIEVLSTIDLEKYRKESCEYWKIDTVISVKE